jgi:hypothetical protein
VGVMREKDGRKLFIKGETPEQAAEHGQVYYHNTRPTLERIRPKR